MPGTGRLTNVLIRVRHDYPDKSVLLDVWRVDDFSGEAHGREGQPLTWVQPQNKSAWPWQLEDSQPESCPFRLGSFPTVLDRVG